MTNGNTIATDAIQKINRDAITSVNGICDSIIMNVGQSYHDMVHDLSEQTNDIIGDLANPLRAQMHTIQHAFVDLCSEGLIVADKIADAIHINMERVVQTMTKAPQFIAKMPKSFLQIPLPYVLDSFTNFAAEHKDVNMAHFLGNINNRTITDINQVMEDAFAQFTVATSAVRAVLKSKTVISAEDAAILLEDLEETVDAKLVEVIQMKVKAEMEVKQHLPKNYDGLNPPNWALTGAVQSAVNEYVIQLNEMMNSTVNQLVYLFERILAYDY